MKTNALKWAIGAILGLLLAACTEQTFSKIDGGNDAVAETAADVKDVAGTDLHGADVGPDQAGADLDNQDSGNDVQHTDAADLLDAETHADGNDAAHGEVGDGDTADVPDACQPDCTGAECGDVGCGGSCGQCATGKACVTGECLCPDECSEVGKKECTDDTHFRTCGDPDSDTCLEWTTSACGGGDTCHDEGICDCTPSCAGKACGDNGCGGSCGGCSNGKTCSGGQCVCAGSTDDDCNGVDDDCDGSTDEGYVPDATCGVGYCKSHNTPSKCVGGVVTPCSPGAKLSTTDATCDGVDDDCSGQTDEDYAPDATCGVGYCKAHNTPSSCSAGVATPCSPGTKLSSTDATCDGVDDDCSGAADEDYVAITSCFKPGACAAGNVASSCAGGVVTACKTGTPAANDATCNVIDDDCDGSTDENATCDDGDPQTTDTCEAGQCKHVSTVTAGFVKLNAGSFWMGSPGGETCPSGYTGGGCPGSGTAASELGGGPDETLHYVKLTRAFELQAKEVTQGDWQAVFPGWNPSNFSSCGTACPVEQVSWYDAVAYANGKSLAAGKPACYTLTSIACEDGTGVSAAADCMTSVRGGITEATVALNGVASPYQCTGYRLPTESEWEYAYRAGSVTAFYPSAGNDGTITQAGRSPLDPNLDQIAWYGGNSMATYAGSYNCSSWFTNATTCGPQPGGGKESNAWGLYDLAGNVWEWCWDWKATYPAGTVVSPAQDPAGGTGSSRVLRGGSWYNGANFARGAYRNYSPPGDCFNYFGFRLARSL